MRMGGESIERIGVDSEGNEDGRGVRIVRIVGMGGIVRIVRIVRMGVDSEDSGGVGISPGHRACGREWHERERDRGRKRPEGG